jgi:2-hydroxy-4-carboxymuconate semialdehyde hemiacetal dehydrogenase
MIMTVYNNVDNAPEGEPMRICMAGEGAIARKHLDALARIDGVEVSAIVGGNPQDTRRLADERGIAFRTGDLAEALRRADVDAVVLATPTPMHAAQAIQVMEAGKHVLVEIPMADSLADSEAVVAAQERTGVTAMVCHTRRFNPSHQWVHQRIARSELRLQHLVVETFFFRRENKNALGQPRTWTDHLLWHHSCHTVDLFRYQTGEEPDRLWAQQGPTHPQLGIAMDMTVGLHAAGSGALCTLALSFNNDGPLGTFFRYICDNGTYVARYDDLVDGYDKPVDLSGVAISNDGIELQDREFVAAVAEGREPNASVAQCLPTMRALDRLEQSLGAPVPS